MDIMAVHSCHLYFELPHRFAKINTARWLKIYSDTTETKVTGIKIHVHLSYKKM